MTARPSYDGGLTCQKNQKTKHELNASDSICACLTTEHRHSGVQAGIVGHDQIKHRLPRFVQIHPHPTPEPPLVNDLTIGAQGALEVVFHTSGKLIREDYQKTKGGV